MARRKNIIKSGPTANNCQTGTHRNGVHNEDGTSPCYQCLSCLPASETCQNPRVHGSVNFRQPSIPFQLNLRPDIAVDTSVENPDELSSCIHRCEQVNSPIPPIHIPDPVSEIPTPPTPAPPPARPFRKAWEALKSFFGICLSLPKKLLNRASPWSKEEINDNKKGRNIVGTFLGMVNHVSPTVKKRKKFCWKKRNELKPKKR